MYISLNTLYLVSFLDLQNMTCPHIQSKMVGILWMIPIYSVDCVLSLVFPGAAVAIGMMRDCYEAYVLYLFLAMLLAFLSNDDETQMIEYLESQPPQPYPSPIHYCNSDMLDGKQYLRFIKFGTLQYCIVKPLMALLALITSWFGLYEQGNFDPIESSYLFIILVTNLSVVVAFSSLLSFFHKFKYDLRPFNPVPKFLSIKSIIFCIYWQGILIALLLEFDVIAPPSKSSYSKTSFAATFQDFLICIEMAIASIINMTAFDYKPYAGEIVEEIFLQRKHSDSLTESLLRPKDEDEDDDARHNAIDSRKPLPRGYRRPPSKKSSKGKSQNVRSEKQESLLGSKEKKKSSKSKKNSDLEKADENVNSRPGSFDCADYDEDEDVLDKVINRERSNSSSKILGTPLLGLVPNADFEQKRREQLTSSMDGGRSREISISDTCYEGGGLEIEQGDGNKKTRSKKKKKGNGLKGIMNKNFAHNTAIRDFNETMPVSILLKLVIVLK